MTARFRRKMSTERIDLRRRMHHLHRTYGLPGGRARSAGATTCAAGGRRARRRTSTIRVSTRIAAFPTGSSTTCSSTRWPTCCTPGHGRDVLAGGRRVPEDRAGDRLPDRQVRRRRRPAAIERSTSSLAPSWVPPNEIVSAPTGSSGWRSWPRRRSSTRARSGRCASASPCRWPLVVLFLVARLGGSDDDNSTSNTVASVPASVVGDDRPRSTPTPTTTLGRHLHHRGRRAPRPWRWRRSPTARAAARRPTARASSRRRSPRRSSSASTRRRAYTATFDTSEGKIVVDLDASERAGHGEQLRVPGPLPLLRRQPDLPRPTRASTSSRAAARPTRTRRATRSPTRRTGSPTARATW